MRKVTLTVILFALLLAACGPQATPSPAPPAATVPAAEQTAPTQASVEPTTAPPTENPPAPAPADGPVIYKIIPGESQLKYEVGEVFINDNNRFKTAMGTTPEVSGEITVDVSAPQSSVIGPITADISQFTSDSSRRDGAIRGRFLESSKYPMVTFVPTNIEGLPATYQEGQDLNLTITGDLTIREVTKPVQFTSTLRLADGALTGEAVTTILMSDFGFGPIDIAGILKTEDEAIVTLNFVARP